MIIPKHKAKHLTVQKPHDYCMAYYLALQYSIIGVKAAKPIIFPNN